MSDTSELDALIVRNIGDIEAAMARAKEIEDDLLGQIGEIMKTAVGSGWQSTVDGATIWTARREWFGVDSSREKASYKITFDEKLGPNGDDDETWLAAMVNRGPSGAHTAFYLWGESFGAKKRWRKLLQNEQATVNRLLDAGFHLDDDQYLYLPAILNPEELALGYENGDLSKALEPVRQALSVIETALPDLEELIAKDQALV